MVDAGGPQTSRWASDAPHASLPRESSGSTQGRSKENTGLTQTLRSLIDYLNTMEDYFKKEEENNTSGIAERALVYTEEATTRARAAWAQAERERGAGRDKQMDRIEAGIKDLQDGNRKQKGPQPGSSWAAVAAQAERREQATREQVSNTVRIRPEEALGSDPTIVLQALRQVVPGLIAVRPLKSGDVDVHVKDQAAKDRLLNGADPVGCKVLRKDYLLEVPGVPLSLEVAHGKGSDNATLIKDIKAATSRIAPGIEINRVQWLHDGPGQAKRWERPGVPQRIKTKGTLIIGVPTQTIQHQLACQGVVIGAELHPARLADNSTTIKQCFKCNGWGHVQSACGAPAKCGKCAGPHETRDCAETNIRCGNCGKGGHRAWQRRACPTFQTYLTDIELKKILLRERTARLREAGDTKALPQGPPRVPQGPDQDGFRTVLPRKRVRETTPGRDTLPRRRVGRPALFETVTDDHLQSSIRDFTSRTLAKTRTETLARTQERGRDETPVATQGSAGGTQTPPSSADGGVGIDDTEMSGDIEIGEL